jgi:hypothetical protein
MFDLVNPKLLFPWIFVRLRLLDLELRLGLAASCLLDLQLARLTFLGLVDRLFELLEKVG